MIHLPASVRVYLCLTPCDMRKSFDALAALVRDYLELDAFAGHLFVFTSRRRDRVKILYWDRDGYALWYKRLEKGVFRFPAPATPRSSRIEVQSSELLMLLDGVDLRSVRRDPRYRRHASPAGR